jgi:hypothetical protein
MLTAQQRGSIVSSVPSTMNFNLTNNNIYKNNQQNNITLLRFSDNIPSKIYSKQLSQDENDSIANL